LYGHEAAFSSKNGTAILKRFRGDLGTNEGMNFISENLVDSDGERVQAICLDEFCQDRSIDHIDLLKLDVQGHEHWVLKGAERLIRAGRVGTIFVELNWAIGTGTTCAATESIHLLRQADYVFSRPGKRFNWENAGDWLRGLSDVVARRVPPAKVFQP